MKALMVIQALNYADANRNPNETDLHTAPDVPLDAGNYVQCAHLWATYRFLPLPMRGPHHANDPHATDAKIPFVEGWSNADLSKWHDWRRAIRSPHAWDAQTGRNEVDRMGATIGLQLDHAPRPLAVVDIDEKDPDALAHALDEFGYTPVIIQSPNGWHCYYLNPHGLKSRGHGLHAWDLKAGKIIIAPLSYGVARRDKKRVRPKGGFKPTQYKWINAPDDLKDAPDAVQLMAIARLLSFAPDMPSLCPKAAVRNWPTGDNVKPLRTVTAQTVKGRIAEPEKPPQANQNHLGYEGRADIGEGKRNNSLYRHMMRTAAPYPVNKADRNSPPAFYIAAAHSFNETRCLPVLPRDEVELTARSAWRFQCDGLNLFKPKSADGTREGIDALRLPQSALKLLAETWGGRQATRTTHERLAPLLRAVLYFNGTQGNFIMLPDFVTRNTGTKCRKRCGAYRTCFVDAGIIEIVERWKRPDADGKGGKSWVYRFTRKGRTMFAETLASHTVPEPKDMQKAVAGVVSSFSAGIRSKLSTGRTDTDRARYNGRLKRCRETHLRATLAVLKLDDMPEPIRVKAQAEYDKTFRALHGAVRGFESTPLIEHIINPNLPPSSAGNQSGRHSSTDRLKVALDKLERIAFSSDNPDPSS